MDIVERLMSAAITTSGRMSANHRLEVSEALIDAATEIARLRKDAERYRWLRKHYGSVNFEPGDHDGMDLIFCVPQGEVSANCDKTVDALMQGANA